MLRLDAASREHETLHDEIVHWHAREIPYWYRFLLASGAISAGIAFVLSTALGSRCFGTIALEEPFSEQVDRELEGKVSNIIKSPLGYAVLVLSAIGLVSFWACTQWEGRYVRSQERKGRKAKGVPCTATATANLAHAAIPPRLAHQTSLGAARLSMSKLKSSGSADELKWQEDALQA